MAKFFDPDDILLQPKGERASAYFRTWKSTFEDVEPPQSSIDTETSKSLKNGMKPYFDSGAIKDKGFSKSIQVILKIAVLTSRVLQVFN